MARTRLDVALVERGYFESRAKAREAILSDLVRVDDAPAQKASALVSPDAMITAQAPHPWVSRGGVKLAAALEHFQIDPAGLDALDVGASTGGFSHVLLARGAAHVTAVDVGHGQLHASLQGLPNLRSLEGRDARDLAAGDFSRPPELVVVDASFISLRLILPHVLSLAAPGACLVALVKPQFEAGRGAVDRGLVRDAGVHSRVCAEIAALVEGLGWPLLGLIPSPIAGGDGNREFLLAARRAA